MTNKFINIGSCGFQKDGWANLDNPSSRYSSWQKPIDFEHDLMTFNPLCVQDESMEIAYTSQTIEHISDQYVFHLFKEVYRILKKGAVFRITCPDIDKCYDAYKNGNENYISGWKRGSGQFRKYGIGEQFLYIFASYLSPFHSVSTTSVGLWGDEQPVKKYTEKEINIIFHTKNKFDALSFFTAECQKHAISLQSVYPGEHISWWGFDKLSSILGEIGFRSITRQEYDQSDVSELKDFDCLNEDNVRKQEYTLFMECVK